MRYFFKLEKFIFCCRKIKYKSYLCVGEYITLYQLQRGMLRQRAQEKDEQVARLAQDKEALRSQLTRLNCLVQQLVGGARPMNTTTNLGNSLAIIVLLVKWSLLSH